MGRLIDAIAAFWNTLIQPDRERKGQKFEELLVDNIFIKEYYDLLHLTQDGLTNHFRYVKSSEYPDFKFQDKITGKKFWVEAKYRTVWFGEFPDQYLYFTTESKLFATCFAIATLLIPNRVLIVDDTKTGSSVSTIITSPSCFIL